MTHTSCTCVRFAAAFVVLCVAAARGDKTCTDGSTTQFCRGSTVTHSSDSDIAASGSAGCKTLCANDAKCTGERHLFNHMCLAGRVGEQPVLCSCGAWPCDSLGASRARVLLKGRIKVVVWDGR